ncbi:c-type cytochrome [Quatrionicoccus australiensis]|uniref:c-type cytochrome n=1 Tax=Quatrionicoccus australiensis TaxID=138118 RepID=UPI001CFBDB9B|nr:c-type cytochrome [Quatrionicoccus australiensis]MCB4358838.1 c-type cytochrome [Quatrionicoccus australiensis]
MRISASFFLGGLLLLAAGPLLAQSARPAAKAAPAVKVAAPVIHQGNAAAGRLKAEDERCVECHGHDGNANDIEDGVGNIGKFPRLAGQNVGYIIKQFGEFRSGKRENETMAVMAKTVSAVDLADIAAYFSSQKAMQGDGKGDNPVGRKLFHEGDPARGILACVGCHNERSAGGVPSAAETPLIVGQHRRYLQKQLMEWRAGVRHNSPGGIMNTMAKTLSDAEIDALADYISGR